jgi:hypothetical protein
MLVPSGDRSGRITQHSRLVHSSNKEGNMAPSKTIALNDEADFASVLIGVIQSTTPTELLAVPQNNTFIAAMTMDDLKFEFHFEKGSEGVKRLESLMRSHKEGAVLLGRACADGRVAIDRAYMSPDAPWADSASKELAFFGQQALSKEILEGRIVLKQATAATA